MINPQKGDEELARGADFTLKCEATGTPPPNVVWKRNGERDPRQEVMLCNINLISPCDCGPL